MRTLTEQQEKTLRELYTEMDPVWKGVLAESMPWLVETTLEVGKWYKSVDSIVNYQGQSDVSLGYQSFKAYGIYDDDWIGNYGHKDSYNGWNSKCNWQPATPEEVEKALINEAKKRGYEPGIFECLVYPKVKSFNNWPYKWDSERNKLYLGGNCLFHNGAWATIGITKEEAEKLLGKKII